MRYLALIAKILLFLLLLGFAAKNAEPVMLHYFLGLKWQAPLSLILFVFFAAGLLMGLLIGMTKRWQQGREILALRKAGQDEPGHMPENGEKGS